MTRSSRFPARRTVPSPYGPRGALPFRFPVIEDPETRDRIARIPGIRATEQYTRCSYDAAFIVADVLGLDPPTVKPPKPGYWKGQRTETFARMKEAMKSRPYQRPMVKFLGLRDYAGNADDMRMGKSIEAEAALVARGCERILHVVPGFARMVWVSEVEQWLKKSHFVLAGRGGDRGWVWDPKTNRRSWTKGAASVADAIANEDVTIVNFDILQAQVERDFNGKIVFRQDLMGQTHVLAKHWWDGAIIDEIHLAKGWRKGKSGWTRADLIAAFTTPEQCPILYGLSGTMLSGAVSDYHSQLRLLAGERIWNSTPWQFHVQYCAAEKKPKTFGQGHQEKTIEYWDCSGMSNIPELQRRLDHIIWGRKRRDVSATMPRITRQLLKIDPGEDRKKVPTPTRGKIKKQPENAVMAYARSNIRVVGPRGVQESLRSCEMGHKIAVFTRYHDSREFMDKLFKDAVRKKTFDLGPDFRYFQIHGRINSDARVALCRDFVRHQGPALVLANMDAMPGGVSLKGVIENHYLEPHSKLTTIFQSESRAAEEGADGITSLFYAIPGSYSMEAYEKLLPKLQIMDAVTNDTDARDLMAQLQTEYEKDLEDILASFLTAVRPGMLDAEGESGGD